MEFPNPSLVLTGVGRSVEVTLAGIDKVRVRAQVRPERSAIRLLCGSNVGVKLTLNNVSFVARYDYFRGFLEQVDIRYTGLDTDVDCSRSLGNLILKIDDDIIDTDEFDLDKLVADYIRQEASSLIGDYSNVFSLEQALEDFETSGNREIREAAENALAYLGGVRSAAAAAIADAITEDLIQRWDLESQAEIDALLDRLVELEPRVFKMSQIY